MKVLVLLCILAMCTVVAVQGQRRNIPSLRNIGAMLRNLRAKIGRPTVPQGAPFGTNVCEPNYKDLFDWDQGYLCDKTLTERCNTPGYYEPGDYDRICNYTWINENIEKALNQEKHVKQGIREQLEAFNTYINLQNIYPDTPQCSVCQNKIEQVWRVNYTMEGSWTICHVMHPRKQFIPYNTCSGQPCDLSGVMGGRSFSNQFMCVPDGAISLNIWIYCPYVVKQCLQTQLILPTSCNCVEAECLDPVRVNTQAEGARDGTLNLRATPF